MATARAAWVRYTVVWIALIGLTFLSFALSTLHLGGADIALALVIAVAKATLVGLFFMHLVEERFTIVMTPIVAIILLLLLIALVAVDVATRHTFPRTPLPDVGNLE